MQENPWKYKAFHSFKSYLVLRFISIFIGILHRPIGSKLARLSIFLKLLINKDEKALYKLSGKYDKLLSYIISNIVGNRPEDVEECLNDTYFKVWKNAHKIDLKKASLKTYLKYVARNTAINRIRDLSKDEIMLEHGDAEEMLKNYVSISKGPEDRAMIEEDVNLLKNILDDLKPREKELVIRKYFYIQSSKVIAQEMNMEVTTVDSYLSRLRKKMKKEFQRREESYE